MADFRLLIKTVSVFTDNPPDNDRQGEELVEHLDNAMEHWLEQMQADLLQQFGVHVTWTD